MNKLCECACVCVDCERMRRRLAEVRADLDAPEMQELLVATRGKANQVAMLRQWKLQMRNR